MVEGMNDHRVMVYVQYRENTEQHRKRIGLFVFIIRRDGYCGNFIA